jgi:hypothetical protein
MDSGPSRRLTEAIDQVIAFFNARRMDLPDGFFDRKTQFLINGAPFETLLGQSQADPLILMLTRGSAGFRFTAKALQHAIPDARVDRPSTPPAYLVEPASLRASGSAVSFGLRLSGTLRNTGEAINTMVDVTLNLNAAGVVETAVAVIDEPTLAKIRDARRS